MSAGVVLNRKCRNSRAGSSPAVSDRSASGFSRRSPVAVRDGCAQLASGAKALLSANHAAGLKPPPFRSALDMTLTFVTWYQAGHKERIRTLRYMEEL